MLETNVDFKLEGTTHYATAKRVSHDTPLTPRVTVNVAKRTDGRRIHDHT